MQCVGRHLGIAALVSGAMVVGMASGASATTLTFLGAYNPDPNGPQITYVPDEERGSLTCTSCTGLLSTLPGGVYDPDVPDASTHDGFSGTSADLFALANSNPDTELAFVNAVIDPDFATTSTQLTTGINNGNASFVTSAEYILFKIGASPDYALIHNTVANNTFDYTAFSNEGAGLSHYVEFGSVSPVPLPAALSFMLTGLAGLGFLGWRKRSAVA